MHFERHLPFKIHKIIFFFQEKTICVPTLNVPKIFRPVTRNTLFFWPKKVSQCMTKPVRSESLLIISF